MKWRHKHGRCRYRMKTAVSGWIKYYTYDIIFDVETRARLNCVSDYKHFDKYHRKDIGIENFNVLLHFTPRNFKASVGWNSDLNRFHVRGRSPKNWSLYRYMFGRCRKYPQNKRIGKPRPKYVTRPVLPKRKHTLR